MSVFAQVRRFATLEIVPSRAARRALAVLAFAAATALGAYAAVPLPGMQVPVTMQTLFVVLSGILLGPWLGAASQLTYLAIGAAGAPVFALGFGPVALLGPTGGYLLSFPLAAFAAGLVAGHGRKGWWSDVRVLAGAAIGAALVLLFGATWLGRMVGAEQGFRTGLLPFLPGDAVKVLLTFLIARRVRERTLGQL